MLSPPGEAATGTAGSASPAPAGTPPTAVCVHQQPQEPDDMQHLAQVMLAAVKAREALLVDTVVVGGVSGLTASKAKIAQLLTETTGKQITRVSFPSPTPREYFRSVCRNLVWWPS